LQRLVRLFEPKAIGDAHHFRDNFGHNFTSNKS
jgi:hypothetical protein